MRRANVAVAVMLLCALAGSVSAKYKIIRVVEIGPASGAPLSPLKWSPSGDRLAYAASGKLMISDTLGNSREVCALEARPRTFEWVDSGTIAVNLQSRRSQFEMDYQLILCKTAGGQREAVAQCSQSMRDRQQSHSDFFTGPFRTLGGKIYFCRTVGQSTKGESATGRQWLSAVDTSGGRTVDHVVLWGDDGLYDITLPEGDSIRVIERPRTNLCAPAFTSVSPDRSHAMYDGQIVNLSDKSSVSLVVPQTAMPAGATACGFDFTSFHPRGNEVLFQLSCDDGHTEFGTAVGTYSLASGEYVILDGMIGISNCQTPTYSPDGSKIALCADGHAYILYREDRP